MHIVLLDVKMKTTYEIFESEEHFKKVDQKTINQSSFLCNGKVDDLKPLAYNLYGEETYSSAESKTQA